MTASPITDPALNALYDYWASKAVGGHVPDRQALDPTDIPSLLPLIMMLDVFDDGRRHYARLVGTNVATGKDPTGTFLQDSAPPGPYLDHITNLFDNAAHSMKATYTEHEYFHPEIDRPRVAKRLLLPLNRRDDCAEKLMVGQIVTLPPEMERSLWQLSPETIRERIHVELGYQA